MKQLVTFLLLGFVLLGLIGCDKQTKNKIKTQADGAIETIDKQVDKIAQQPNALQPIAKKADEQVNTAHSLTHPDTSTKAATAKTSSQP